MNDAFFEFVNRHFDDDTDRLLLNKGKWPDIDVELAVSTINSKKKLKTKVPQLYQCPGFVCPLELAAEQCSSEVTAIRKASIIKSLGIERVADLTGGLGVDSMAFSKIAEKVLYNEMRENLFEAVKNNFSQIGISNVEFSNKEITTETIKGILEEFAPDLVYMDPARRAATGSKVFKLEDCSPDILKLKDIILDSCRYLVAKLSPMADISKVCSELGPHCKEVVISGFQGECKELLVIMDISFNGEYTVSVADEGSDFSFRPSEERQAEAFFPHSQEDIIGAEYLYEPSKCILKSGGFNTVSERFRIMKPDISTHIYLGKGKPAENFPGKTFKIEECLPFCGKTLKELSKRGLSGDVTARNLPIKSEELKARLKISSGNSLHIFAIGCGKSGNHIFICRKDI